MLFVPVLFEALVFFSFIPCVDTPNVVHQDITAYNGTFDIAVPRYGYSPSYELSAARVGSSPSYALSVSRLGSTPLLAFLPSTQCDDSTSLLEPRMSDIDHVEWNDVDQCAVGVAPFTFLFSILSLCMFFTTAIFHRLFASFHGFNAFYFARLCTAYLVSLCACLFRSLRACLVSGLRTLVSVGLCFLIALGCLVLLLVGSLAFLFAFTTLVAFQVFLFALFNCFCGCLFVGHLWYNIYLKRGPQVSSVLGICLGVHCGMGMTLFVGLCAFYYYGICKLFGKDNADKALFANLISGVSFWLGDKTEEFVHSTWRPLFDFSSGAFFCSFTLFNSFVLFGPHATFFFYGVRPFLSSAVLF